jgi:hypothetical protein
MNKLAGHADRGQENTMDHSGQDSQDLRGWALINLEDPQPKRARAAAEKLGVSVEEFIHQALQEKLDRIEI